MRRAWFVFALIATSCTAGTAVTTSSAPPAPTTVPTTTIPPTTTTTVPPTTTTSLPPTTTLPPLNTLAYEEIAKLSVPVQMTARPGEGLAYLATKDGRVWLFENGEISPDPVLDLRDLVHNEGERGFLSLALHPTDAARFFAHYTANGGDTVVSEFAFSSPELIDRDSERQLLRLAQPAANHNGGMIQFGPDGTLFVGLGDGGGSNDRFNNGQNTDTLLGGLVEISVDGEPSPTLYAHGLRNPWRFWIDGDVIFVADVGQARFEEITFATLVPGINFGWPITEGLHCFRPSSGCDMAGLTLPQIEVAHGDGGACSITGGQVYHGSAIPELSGYFLYSDYCGGFLRSILVQDGVVVDQMDLTPQVGIAGRVVGFGVDGDGELYVATTGRLLKLVAVRGE